MSGRFHSVVFLVFTLSLTPCSVLFAQPIPAFVVVERLNTAGSNGNAVPVFHDRYDPLIAAQGSPLGTIAFPTTVNGTHRRLTESNTATSSGLFTRYVNGQGYAVSGYDAAPATASVASTNPGTVNRIIGTVSPTFAIDTQTGYNNGGTTTYRSVASVDGSAFWVSIGAGSDGIVYIPTPGTIAPYVQILGVNSRQVRIFNNSLFYSTSSATPTSNGVFLLGTPGTLPTSAATATQLPGLGTSGVGTPGANGFYLFDNPLNSNNWNSTGFDTLYVADERSAPNGGGIQRWVFDGANWTLTGTMNGAAGVRGLTATIDASGLVNLWATTTQTNVNNLIFVQDTLDPTSGTFGIPTTLATAATNTVFRGVEIALVSIPEPSTIVLVVGTLAVGIQVYLRKRHRKDAPAH